MSTSTLMTAEELLRLPKDGFRYELVRGELQRMSPAGFQHGQITLRIGAHLLQHVKQAKLGTVVTSDPGFKLESSPDTVLAPDVAFVSTLRISLITDQLGFADIAPDLAIEVLSPNDSLPKLIKKCEKWLEQGTQAAVLVNPRRHIVTLYQPNEQAMEFALPQSLTIPKVVPGWAMPVREMFE